MNLKRAHFKLSTFPPQQSASEVLSANGDVMSAPRDWVRGFGVGGLGLRSRRGVSGEISGFRSAVSGFGGGGEPFV